MRPTLLIFLLLFVTGASAPAPKGAEDPPASSGGGVVVLELFTSQGCSSCPPADALLSEVGRRDDVIALSYHVDYWNYIGWTDPFSRREWSERQQRYAASMRSAQVYTPQLVVNGVTQVVGSNRGGVRAELARHSSKAAPVRLRLELKNEQLKVRTTVDSELGRPLDLMIAIYEERTETAVPRGENAGRTLRNDFVVRGLMKAGSVSGRPGTSDHAAFSLRVDGGWNRARLGVAAFVQDPNSLRILGGSKMKF